MVLEGLKCEFTQTYGDHNILGTYIINIIFCSISFGKNYKLFQWNICDI